MHRVATAIFGVFLAGSPMAVMSTPAYADSEPSGESTAERPLSWIDDAPVLRRADRGTAVAAWQELLNRWLASRSDDDGFRLETDGDFGPLTDAVTRSLQFSEALPVDGIVGPVTRAGYLSSPALATRADDPARDFVIAGPGASGPDVASWQNSLNQWREASGAPGTSIEVDGVFGPATGAATRRFQAAQSITVDGLVGPETIAALLSAPALVNPSPSPPAPVDSAPTGVVPPAPVDPAPADQYQRAMYECAAGHHVHGFCGGTGDEGQERVVHTVEQCLADHTCGQPLPSDEPKSS